MAPARKKSRVLLVGSESHESQGSDPVPPASLLKDTVPSFPSVKPPPSTDETEEANLRRKTYFVREEQGSDENDTCVIYYDPAKTSNAAVDQTRRLTYNVPPHSYEGAESPQKKHNPGAEMIPSEMEITEMQLQVSKRKNHLRKKKTAPALQEVMESEITDDKKENESLLTGAPAGRKPRKRAQKKPASSEDAQVKTLEGENAPEIPTSKAKGRRKKVKVQENEEIPSGSNTEKIPAKRGRKKKAN